MLSDDLGEKKMLRKGLNFSMLALFRLRNIALKCFSLCVCKKCLCYDKLTRSSDIISQGRPLF